jgi:hypothetical protein
MPAMGRDRPLADTSYVRAIKFGIAGGTTFCAENRTVPGQQRKFNFRE